MEDPVVTTPMSDSKDALHLCRRLRDIGPETLRNRIVKKVRLSENISSIEVEAPLITAACKAGQFVVVRPNERAERIPLTISDSNAEAGTISIIFQAIGRSTRELAELNEGDFIPDLAGPLGSPTEIENFGNAVCVGGGLGAAFLRPIVSALRAAGNQVTTIIGARDKSLIILENEMREISNNLVVATDNGSYGVKGFVTEVLRGVLDAGEADIVYAIGPMPMMRAISELTRPYGVKTIVSLDPIMIDGTGMCGGCRVTVGGETKFTCVDGPDFDGHQVDWDELKSRKLAYAEEEQLALERTQQQAEGSR